MSMLLRRNLLIPKTSGRLPSGYQEVSGLWNPGGAYIDSGIECTSDLAVKFSFAVYDIANTAICGGIDTSASPYFRHHCTPVNSTWYWMMRSTASTANISGTAFFDGTHNEVEVDPVAGIAKLNGVTETFTPFTTLYTTGKNYGIFARISQTGALQQKNSSFYYFKFYRDGVLIGDLVTCRRKADNKPGMYDIVRNVFLTNAGTGEFTPGPDVN